MEVQTMPLEGVLLLRPKVHGDDRGFFFESYRQETYAQAGIALPFVQDNCSRSRKGILRGLHFQREYPQGKLVMVTSGAVFDVAVDIRPDSPTFGQWCGIELSERNHLQLWIPLGMAHGFCVLSEQADFYYKCTDYYHPEDDYSIRWDDPDLNITWPTGHMTLSKKDRDAPYLREIFKKS